MSSYYIGSRLKTRYDPFNKKTPGKKNAQSSFKACLIKYKSALHLKKKKHDKKQGYIDHRNVTRSFGPLGTPTRLIFYTKAQTLHIFRRVDDYYRTCSSSRMIDVERSLLVRSGNKHDAEYYPYLFVGRPNVSFSLGYFSAHILVTFLFPGFLFYFIFIIARLQLDLYHNPLSQLSWWSVVTRSHPIPPRCMPWIFSMDGSSPNLKRILLDLCSRGFRDSTCKKRKKELSFAGIRTPRIFR